MISQKWRNVLWLSLAELLAMTLWFSASAVLPQLIAEWDLSPAQQSWMTMSVQLGFVIGALLSALFNVSDRFSSRHLFALSAFTGAMLTAMIPLGDSVVNFGPELTLVLRFFTGVCLAGVYPPGMKLVATWCKEDRGFGIGLLVGALTLGSAMPHLLNALPLFEAGGMPPWRSTLLSTSGMGILAGLIILFQVKTGPFLNKTAHFNWRFATQALAYPPTRLANFGYLGHMWELYAMWTWVPLFLIASYEKAGWHLQSARLAGFFVIAIGSLGCILAGKLADRFGRTTLTIWSLVISGICAMISGLSFAHPALLTFICLIWGFSVVADSAQFSAAVSELSDARYVGTALTVQTSLGFLLTLFSIRIIPPLVERVGWEWAFMPLAIGPVLGIWSMLRLRKMPEAVQMASGRR